MTRPEEEVLIRKKISFEKIQINQASRESTRELHTAKLHELEKQLQEYYDVNGRELPVREIAELLRVKKNTVQVWLIRYGRDFIINKVNQVYEINNINEYVVWNEEQQRYLVYKKGE